MTDIEFPEMRAEVVRSVEALADPEYQQRVWIKREYPSTPYYDDLDMNIHTLFDDTEVLGDAQGAVGTILHPDEVHSFTMLFEAFNPLIDDLGDASDDAYLAHPRWPLVVERARAALATLRAGDSAGREP